MQALARESTGTEPSLEECGTLTLQYSCGHTVKMKRGVENCEERQKTLIPAYEYFLSTTLQYNLQWVENT